MIKRPVIAPGVQVEAMEAGGVLTLRESGHYLLSGDLYRRMMPLIDGRRTADELVHDLHPADAAQVYYALHRLEQRGYIVDADAPGAPDAAAFWRSLGVDADTAGQRLEQATVSIVACGETEPEPLIAALADLGVRVGDDGDFVIAITDHYLRRGLAAVNERALATGRPWLLARPVGRQLWMGPLFRPGQTACWHCLAHRLRLNSPFERFLQKRRGTDDAVAPAVAALPASRAAAWHLIALETARWLALEKAERLDNALITLDPLELETRRHVVVRRPQCPQCGDPAYAANHPPAPVVLASRPTPISGDAGVRMAQPEATLARFEHHVSPITGVVSMLVHPQHETFGLLHTYLSGYNFAYMNDDPWFIRRHLRSGSGGKGTTDAQARVSALGEAIERYSGIFQGDEPRRQASFRELGAAAIDPASCLLYSEAQYRDRDRWNEHAAPKQSVPNPFDPEMVTDWTPVWSLTDQAFKYLPTALLYYGHPTPRTTSFCNPDSNGSAAGSTLEEAILQGLMELVERDAVALWWYNRVRRPAVDLASFQEPYIDQLVRHYQSVHRDLWVLDITTDLGIPTFAAISRRTDKPVEDILVGFAAHLDPRIALLRALTEVNQCLPAMLAIQSDGSGEYGWNEPEIVEWFTTATLANQPYLAPDEAAPLRTRGDYVSQVAGDIREDVLLCQRRLERLGMEVLVLDQTRADIGLPVVKVIVPGLRHFWKRLAPGRLYDVPVQLGWLPQPLTEEELNPVPVFL